MDGLLPRKNEHITDGDSTSHDLIIEMKQRSGHDDPVGSLTSDDPSLAPPEDHTLVPDFPTISIFGKRFNRTVIVIHSNIVLYSTCFWIQIGALPYLSKSLGVDPVVFGYLQTTFAVVQLCGAPVFGRFGDIYGGRAAMTLAFGAATTSYLLTGLTNSIPMLFISRLPSLLMHAMQGGQMIVTDLSQSGQRADALGKLGISYGIGMVLGPFIGGIFTKHSIQLAVTVSCIGSLLSMAMSVTLLPPSTKQPGAQPKEGKSSTNVFSISKIMSLLKIPQAALLLAIKLISGIPIGIFQSMFPIIAIDTFKLEPDQNGYLMSYIGIIAMIVQGVGIGLLLQRFSDISILRLSAIILMFAYILLSYAVTVFQLCVVLVPLCVGLTLMNVVISSALTKTVDDSNTGAMLGLNMAVNNIIRTISPTIGGFMLASYGFPAFGYLGFGTCVLVTLFLFKQFKA